MKPATIAPAFCALYPMMAEICRKHGYALAVHGTVQSDFDVIAIPWTPEAGTPQAVVDDLCASPTFERHGEPNTTHHGRIRQGLLTWGGAAFCDLSFMPRQAQPSDGEG